MKLTIHRGTNQIGGSLTEIESGGYKIFIDFGEQLPGENNHDLGPIEGLTCGDVSKSALFITHYHSDHIGKINETDHDLKIFTGTTALKIFQCLEEKLSHIQQVKEADKHKSVLERIGKIQTFEVLQKVTIGEITVIPLLVDHSAFDAYMFIVEAEGKRILHTGDFRRHGFRGKGLGPMLKKYARNIDYLVTEGTNIQRPNVKIQTERDLQIEFKSQFRETKYNFVLVSSTNIDRIFALYHAAKEAKRCFICDKYQKEIMKIVSDNHKQYTPFYNIDYDQGSDFAGRFITLYSQNHKPDPFNGNLKPFLENHGFVMLFRTNDLFKPILDEYASSNESQVYFSMWNGYLDNSNSAYNKSMYDFLKPYKLKHLHTSGHADAETLKAVYEIVNPKFGIIPIHTDAPDRFLELFREQTFILLKDGETLDCNQNDVGCRIHRQGFERYQKYH